MHELPESSELLGGVQALARVPLEVRRIDTDSKRHTGGFVSGYEGSPLGGFDIEVARQHKIYSAAGVVFRPGLNEELAATAVQGTQIASHRADDLTVDGVTGYWYGKSPGLDRAADAVRHANLVGAHPAGGAVLFVGDDPGAKSSTVPGSSELLLADLGVPTLTPADSGEVLTFGLHAVFLSRASGLWTALRISTPVADGSSNVSSATVRREATTADLAWAAVQQHHEITMPSGPGAIVELERSRDRERLATAIKYARKVGINRVSGDATARIGIISSGKTFLDVRQALTSVDPDGDVPVRLLKLGMTFPLDAGLVREFADGLDEVLVVEEKRSMIETGVKDALYRAAKAPYVVGKTDRDLSDLVPAQGEIVADQVVAVLRRVLARHGSLAAAGDGTAQGVRQPRVMLPLLTRTPYFCSGCPHNSSLKVPEGALVGAGIGCHGMARAMPVEQVGELMGMAQMGGEGAHWFGMAPFAKTRHVFQNLGDGTFHHSGSLAIRAAVASGANITYKILYNSAVAMTGGQTPVGQMSVPQIVSAMAAEGVSHIVITADDPRRYRKIRLPRGVRVHGREDLISVQEELSQVPGVTILIHDQECAAELRRKRKRGLVETPRERVVINQRICEGCGDCGRKSNCLSVHPVETFFGRKTEIEVSSCNLDLSCLDGDCPAFVKVLPDSGTAAPAETPTAKLVTIDAVARRVNQFSIRLVGIGGTGVVTAAEVIAQAAKIDGYHVKVMHQTGLSQKGGAVCSDVLLFGSEQRADAHSNRVGDGECDLYLACDVLASASPAYLSAVSSRTTAVVSSSRVPTGPMVADPAISFPVVDELLDVIRSAAGKSLHVLDARATSTEAFGDDQFANLLLIGEAFRAGAVPIRSSSVVEAVTRAGVRVDSNVAAFRRGAGLSSDLPRSARPGRALKVEETAKTLMAQHGIVLESDLGTVLVKLVSELISYQDVRYARRFLDRISDLASREGAATTGSSSVSVAAAHALFKVMAYKDEYEVARLALLPEFEQSLKEQFGPRARSSVQLHPPVLRALGMKRKISIGRWGRPALVLLRASRSLRGTAFDPFGYARVRRIERSLARDVENQVRIAAEKLDATNRGDFKALFDLTKQVRGYEDIKLRSVEIYQRDSSALLAHAVGR